MNSLNELTHIEIITITGGVSFAYRAGQLLVMIIDHQDDGYIDTYAGLKAYQDWFG